MTQNNIMSSMAVFNYSNQKLCDLYDSEIDLTGQAYNISFTTGDMIDGVKSLSFCIPYMADGIENFRWNYLKNEYLIRLIYNGETEWYVAQKPAKHKEKGIIYGEVTCAGLEVSLKTKNIYMEFDDSNGIGTVTELAAKILAGTGWHIGYADTLYEADGVTEKIRSIQSGSKQGALGLMSSLCNLFKCYPVYKSDTKLVDLYSYNNRSQVVEGVVGINLDALHVTPESADIITRLYVEGEYADDGYIGIDDVNPTGLPYIMNFNYFKEIGLFTAAHQDALDAYVAEAARLKTLISTTARLLLNKEDEANGLVGQCDLVVYYKTSGYTTPMFIYGTPLPERQALQVGDKVVVLQNNGQFRYATITTTPAAIVTNSDYGIAKFITSAAGSIGAYEVQIEAKEKEIANLERKINATSKEEKIAEYEAEIEALQAAIQTIYTRNNGLYNQMHSLMNSSGCLYNIKYYNDLLASYQDDLDDAESDFIIAMGDMIRDGYWNNHNYIQGQEQHLYDDAVDVLDNMSKPTITHSFNLVRLHKDYGIPIESIKINALFRVWDEELNVADNLFVTKVTIGVDDESAGAVEVSNKDITLSSNDLGTLLSRMSQLADLIEQKNTMYDRAKAIARDNTFYANRLNGQIDVLKNQLLSTVSNWSTDENGNIIFLSVDGTSAMMLCGAGFMIANSKDNDGNWAWRTFGTGEGFTADEIVAGFISAERIEAGSIAVDKLEPGVGGELVISGNPTITGINTDISNINKNIAPAFSTSTTYAVGDIVSRNGKLYRFTTAHPAGAWNSGHVAEITVSSQFKVTASSISTEVSRAQAAEKATATNIAPAFSTSTTYAVGDIVSYEGKIYKFTSAHPAGAWNASHVTATTMNAIAKAGFIEKTTTYQDASSIVLAAEKQAATNTAPAFSTSTAYAVGDVVSYNGVVYRFTSAHAAGAWNASHVTATNALAQIKITADSVTSTVQQSAAANVAPAFSTSTTYAVGNVVSYNGKIYKFTSAHPAGAWNASHVSQTTMNAVATNAFIAKTTAYQDASSIVLAAEKQAATNTAPAFSTSTAYAVGDVVSYNGVVYRFTSAHAAGAWNASHVTATNALAQIKITADSVTSTVQQSAAANVAPAFSTSTTYAVGNVVSYNGKIYKFTSAHPAGAWNASHVSQTTMNAVATNAFIAKTTAYQDASSIVLAAEKQAATNVAPAFSTSTAYAVGDVVSYNGVVYKFTSAHSAGAWNSSHVSTTNALAQIKVTSDAISLTVQNTATNVAPAFSTSTAYAVGDVVAYQGKIYKFTSAHSAGAWNSSHVSQTNLNAVSKSAYYGQISGITINSNGVTITGSKYVDIASGGYVKVGNWKFNNSGVYGIINSTTEFSIGAALTSGKEGVRINPGQGLSVSIRYYSNVQGTTLADKTFAFRTGQSPSDTWSRISGAIQSHLSLTGINAIGDTSSSIGYVFSTRLYSTYILPYPGSSYWQKDESGNYEHADFTSGNIGDAHGRWSSIYANTLNVKGIYYTGTNATYKMIDFVDNATDTYGNGIVIGGGGLVVIGAGDAASAIASGKSGGTEQMYIGSDNNVYIYTLCQGGVEGAKIFTFDTSGNLYVPNKIYKNNVEFKDTWRGFAVQTFSYQYTIAANGTKDITGANFGVGKTGYTPVAAAMFNSGSVNVVTTGLSITSTGQNAVMALKNLSSSSITATAYISILYLQN